jgi:hypothetical protein
MGHPLKLSVNDGGSERKVRDLLLELLLVFRWKTGKCIEINYLEARGVEPLSLRPLFQVSTCLADRN